MMGSTDWPRVRPDRLSLPEGLAPQPPLKDLAESLESTRVQTLRGLACLLLVAFHTVGASANFRLHVPDDSVVSRVYQSVRAYPDAPLHLSVRLRVRLSAATAQGRRSEFSARKIRRLGVPFPSRLDGSCMACTSRCIMRCHRPSRMWTVYVFPFWHMWFVQSLLVVFAALARPRSRSVPCRRSSDS